MILKGFGTSAAHLTYAAITLALAAGVAAGTAAASPASDEGPNAVPGISRAWDAAAHRAPALTLTSGTTTAVTVGAEGDEGPNAVAAGAQGDEGPNVVATG